jgi:hypothetical protein
MWWVLWLIGFWMINALAGLFFTYFALSILYMAFKAYFQNGRFIGVIFWPCIIWLAYALFAVVILNDYRRAAWAEGRTTRAFCIRSIVFWLLPFGACVLVTAGIAICATDALPDIGLGGDAIDLWDYFPSAAVGIIWFLVPLAISIGLLRSLRQHAEPVAPGNPGLRL